MKLKLLLKLATLLLVVAAMMMPTTGCARPRKLSSISVPSVRTIENVMHKLQNSKTPTLPSGIKMLAKRTENNVLVDSPGFECGIIVAGQNAKARIDHYSTVTATATGGHAWYLQYDFCTSSTFTIYFKSKADRDLFWKLFKKSRHFQDYNTAGDDGLSYDDGWYGVILDGV